MSQNSHAYETIARNTKVGEMFTVVIQGDPVTYTGIPVLPADMASRDDPEFSFKIIEPDDLRGVKRWPVRKIQVLEKVEES